MSRGAQDGPQPRVTRPPPHVDRAKVGRLCPSLVGWGTAGWCWVVCVGAFNRDKFKRERRVTKGKKLLLNRFSLRSVGQGCVTTVSDRRGCRCEPVSAF